MVNSEKWARRVKKWRASGLTSSAFCEGKPFTAGGLRHWAHRLREELGQKAGEPAVRIGRVVRVPAPAAQEGREVAVEFDRIASAAASEVVVELGAARVTVRAGFHRATLAAVLEVLAASGGAR